MSKTLSKNALTAVQKIVVHEDDAGQRVDNFTQRVSGGLPKSRLYRIIRKGELRVNSKRVKPEYRLLAGDIVRLPPLYKRDQAPVAGVSPRLKSLLENAVLHEDDALLVLNKPAGLAVHGGSGVNVGLIEALRQIRPQDRTLELVHRLDRDTSGCLMIAKKRSMLRRLHANLREGHITKRYAAIVDGVWPADLTEINAPLIKNQLSSGERYVKVAADGRRSVTRFGVERACEDATLLDIGLLTGRTHQIRVHTQYAGHPVVGDQKYGDAASNARFKAAGNGRLFLHAKALTFVSPASDQKLTVEAPFDDAFDKLISELFRC